jgi:hypothetical protein
MTSFLNSLKDDLLDRRLLPLVAVVAVGLLAAVGYVALGGGSSAATPSGPAVSASAAPPAGLSVSRVTPEKAVAETTAGVADQRKGAAHNPFTPLPQPAEKKTTLKLASANAASPSSASAPSEPSSAPAGESSAPAPSTPAPSAPPKPTYHVAVLFGVAPATGTPEPEKLLTPYENLKLLAPLPSAKQALVVFRGVTAGGKTATFTIVSEAILHGQAKCLPSEEQCQAIALAPGQIETLEYVSASGQPVTYELQVVGITSSTSSSSGSGVQSILRDESKAGRELLRHEGLGEVPGLRYSAAQGVLVHAGH